MNKNELGMSYLYKIRHTLAALLMLMFFSSSLIAQERTISGIVTESLGQPLEGVSVGIKGSAVGTITDLTGKFSLRATQGDTIVCSFVGYKTLAVGVVESSTFDIIMQPGNISLEDVVVVGYGTQQKKDLTGAVSSVSGKELKSLPVPDIGQALQGRAAGVQIISSGAPGSNVTIRVRGTGTINNSDPLLVIDGIPTDLY